MKFYLAENQKPVGPFEVSELIAHGIKGEDLVWTEGYETWVPASTVSEIAAAIEASNTQDEQYKEAAIPQLPPEINGQPEGCPPPPPFQAQYQAQPQPNMNNNVVNQLPPKSWLVESILVTLLCCLPFGIVGIINAANVNGQWQAGQYEQAQKSSDNAKKWTIIGAVCGLIGVIISVIFTVVGSLAELNN